MSFIAACHLPVWLHIGITGNTRLVRQAVFDGHIFPGGWHSFQVGLEAVIQVDATFLHQKENGLRGK